MTDPREARLQEIEARLSGATPGPWKAVRGGDFQSVKLNSGTLTVDFWDGSWNAGPREGHWKDSGDIDLIEKAPEDIAWLLAEVRRLKLLNEVPKITKCKDIEDVPLLKFIDEKQKEKRAANKGSWVHVWDFEGTSYFDLPDRLFRAKMGKLIKRKLVSGCNCGCRGDYELTGFGRALIEQG